ncbi:MAG: hypothetical protein IJZ16_14130 [Clostridia bacterium]|nr:hypothetical protein [Clostridia bacterium]
MKKKGIKILVIIFTIIIILGVCIFSYLFLNGLSGLHLKNDFTDGQIKVACVGDSITYGHGVSNWSKNNYPVVLQNLLGDKYNVQNFGVSGATTQKTGDQPYVDTKSYNPSVEYNADILIFMLGSNDSKPYNWKDRESFKNEYVDLLNTYISDNDSVKVYLCTVSKVFYNDESQTSGPSTFDIQGDIVDIINDVIKEIATEYGYNLIDIYSLTKEHPEWFKDNIHPDANGAKAIAEEMYKNI